MTPMRMPSERTGAAALRAASAHCGRDEHLRTRARTRQRARGKQLAAVYVHTGRRRVVTYVSQVRQVRCNTKLFFKIKL
jgi:hypothetical protein